MDKFRDALWRDTRLNPHRCCYCGHNLDAAGSPMGDVPEPGNASVCIHCGGIMVFDANMRLRMPSVTEMPELLSDKTIQEFQRIVRQIHEGR